MKHWFSDVHSFKRDPLNLIVEKSQQGGSLQKLHLGPAPIFLVSGPSAIKPLLKASQDKIDKGRLVNKLRPIVGNSSLVVSGEEHARRRSVMHDCFSRQSITTLVPELSAVITEQIARLVTVQKFDAHTITARLALRLVSTVLFGHSVLTSGDEEALLEAIASVEAELSDEMFRAWPLLPHSAKKRATRLAHARNIMSVVVSRAQKHASSDSLLLALQSLGLSPRDVEDELLTMMIAGHHTTGSAAAWLLYHVASNKGVAQQLAAEARTLSDENGEISLGALKNASVATSFVREILRVYPSVWWFSRETKQPFEIDGHKLKRGTSLLFCPWQLHRDPKYWDAPNEFRLDRNHTNQAFLPFGTGPRVCVGLALAMTQLQMMALLFASSVSLSYRGMEQPSEPRASLTLIPPQIPLGIDPDTNSIQSPLAA